MLYVIARTLTGGPGDGVASAAARRLQTLSGTVLPGLGIYLVVSD